MLKEGLNYTQKDMAEFWQEAITMENLQTCNSSEDMFMLLRDLAKERLNVRTQDEFDMVISDYIYSSHDILDMHDIEDATVSTANTNTYASANYQNST